MAESSEKDHRQRAKMADEEKLEEDEVKEEKRRGRAMFLDDYSRKHKYRTLAACITVFLLLAGIIVLTLWLVYHPRKPQFTVAGGTINDLNISALPLLTTTMQFTIVIRNPSRQSSIHCDRLSAFVVYRNQEITPPVILPPLRQREGTTVGISPVISGGGVPVPVEVANGLVADVGIGLVGFSVVVDGRMRWNLGAIKTAHYGLRVICDVLVGIRNGFVGQIPLLSSRPCRVDV